MSNNWDFYQCLVDDSPASIFLDMGLAGNAPVRGQPHLAYVRIFMRRPRPDGLSGSEEFDDLVGLEKTLELALGSEDVTYAGRNTSDGTRNFYFYTSDPAAFAPSVESAMTRHPEYRFEVGGRPDPEWGGLFRLPLSLAGRFAAYSQSSGHR